MDYLEFNKHFAGKSVLVTGHTGFKGAWLATLLQSLGADVTGVALPPENIRGNLCEAIGLEHEIQSFQCDIRNLDAILDVFSQVQPEHVFHLAAQSIVFKGYENPVENFSTNAMGTVHILEAIRQTRSVKTAVLVTTDKCYENQERVRAYRETDRLGGRDPYACSKTMAEHAINAYRCAYFCDSGPSIASARAGNVIGGGDYGAHRLIPDIVEAAENNTPVTLRNPNSVRPWQHVLDALFGYLQLSFCLREKNAGMPTAYNFSPKDDSESFTVEYLTKKLISALDRGRYVIDPDTRRHPEAKILRLDSALARHALGWTPVFSTQSAIDETAQWYKRVHFKQESASVVTREQVQRYLEMVSQCNAA